MQDDGPDRDDAPDSGQDAGLRDDQHDPETPLVDEADPADPADPADQVDGFDERWEAETADEADWLDEPSSRRVWVSALAGTFVLGVVTSLLVVVAWGMFTGDAGDDADGRPTDATTLAGMNEPLDGTSDSRAPDAGVTAPADRRVATRLSRCASASRTIADALEAAQPSLDQWAVHVGAMNKLVVGEITLQQATAFWNRTRVGAQRRLADFREEMRTLRRRGVDCPSPALLAPGARALPGCVRQVEAQTQVVRAATTSIDTWDQHVQHMDMMLLGELSPEDATRMWLSMWEQGVRDLDAYRAAAREARELDGCALVGSPG